MYISYTCNQKTEEWLSSSVFIFIMFYREEFINFQLFSSIDGPWTRNSCIVDFEINAWSRSSVNLQINLLFIYIPHG